MPLVLRVQELPILQSRRRGERGRGHIEAFVGLDFNYRASLIAKYGLPA